jgi:hypothetical protein
MAAQREQEPSDERSVSMHPRDGGPGYTLAGRLFEIRAPQIMWLLGAGASCVNA